MLSKTGLNAAPGEDKQRSTELVVFGNKGPRAPSLVFVGRPIDPTARNFHPVLQTRSAFFLDLLPRSLQVSAMMEQTRWKFSSSSSETSSLFLAVVHARTKFTIPKFAAWVLAKDFMAEHLLQSISRESLRSEQSSSNRTIRHKCNVVKLQPQDTDGPLRAGCCQTSRCPRGTSCNGTETLRGMPFLAGRLKSKNQNYSKPKNHNYSKRKNQKYSKHKQELMAPSFSLFQACNPLRGRNDCGFCAWTYYQSQAR